MPRPTWADDEEAIERQERLLEVLEDELDASSDAEHRRRLTIEHDAACDRLLALQTRHPKCERHGRAATRPRVQLPRRGGPRRRLARRACQRTVAEGEDPAYVMQQLGHTTRR
jgi:hypothetical protein